MTPVPAAMLGGLVEYIVLAACVAVFCLWIVTADAIADWLDARRARHGTVTVPCHYCDGDRHLHCECDRDCGRRYCPWATFRRELDALLDAEGGRE